VSRTFETFFQIAAMWLTCQQNMSNKSSGLEA
jgi:hypothetical protein